MEKYQPNKIIQVSIEANEDESFFYDSESSAIVGECEAPACVLTMNMEAYQAILGGMSTCEEEIHNSNIKISGDVNLLREIGKAFRARHARA